MKEVKKYVSSLKLGDPQVYRNLAIAPLMGKDSKLDYLTFDEAVNSGLSIDETGSVPTLHFTNKTGKEILILQG